MKKAWFLLAAAVGLALAGHAVQVGAKETEEALPNLTLSEEMQNGAPGYQVAMTKEELKEILFTSGQEEMIENGAKAKVAVTVNNVTDTIDPVYRAKLISDPLMNYQGYVVLRYLDIRLRAGMGNEPGAVTETYDPIWITLEIPEEYRNTDPYTKRFYALFDLAHGNPVYLCDLDQDENTLTVAINWFGPCALLMKDMYVDGILKEPYIEEETGWRRLEDGRIETCTYILKDVEKNKIIYLDEFGKRAEGWRMLNYDTEGWTYFDPETGYQAEEGWMEIEGERYHFNCTRERDTGWIEVDGRHYYLDGDGRMARSEWVTVEKDTACGIPAGKYYIGEDGALLTDTLAEFGTEKADWYMRFGDGLATEDDPPYWSSVNPEW